MQLQNVGQPKRHLYLVPAPPPREEVTTREAARRFGLEEELFLSVASYLGWERTTRGLWDFEAIEESL